MRKIFSISLLLLITSFFPGVYGQDIFPFKHSKTLPTDAVNFTADNLGNIFLVNKFDQIKKVNSNGDSIAVFNEVRKFGQLYSIDATNPLKIIAFYKDFMTIIFLDRFLKTKNRIDLRRLNIFQVRAVATSYDNNIWVYDELENKLKKIDDNGNLLSETVDLRIIFDKVPTPEKIIDQEGFVYLYDSKLGAFAFDYYGAFRNHYPIKDLKNFTVIANTIYGIEKESIYKYTIGSLNVQYIPLADDAKNPGSIYKILPNRFFVLSNEKINIYTIGKD